MLLRKILVLITFGFIGITTSLIAEARVFDFKNEFLAPYFRVTGGMNSAGSDGFALAKGGSSILQDKGSRYSYSGEFGVLLRLDPNLSFRFGMEFLQGERIDKLKALDVSGSELYELNNNTLVFSPVGAFELGLYNTPTFRFFGFGGVGYSVLRMSNEYNMTALGESTYVPSYTEELEGNVMSYTFGAGLETLLTDTTTLELDLGYRVMKFANLKHRSGIEAIQGTFAPGTPAINDNGTTRNIDMGGVYVGLSFRFYVRFI